MACMKEDLMEYSRADTSRREKKLMTFLAQSRTETPGATERNIKTRV